MGDIQQVNVEAAKLAEKFDFLRPEEINESAVLHPGTQFVLDDSGAFTILDAKGNVLAWSDCQWV